MKIINFNLLPEVPVSHDQPIKKKVIIPSGDIAGLQFFSHVVMLPNDRTSAHSHKTMYEVFYAESGRVTFNIDGKKFVVKKGDTIIIEPGEVHFQYNPYKHKVSLLYFGIATK